MSERTKHTSEPWYWDQAADIDDGFVFYLGPDHERGGPVPVQRKIEWEHGLDPDENPEQFAEAEATADLIVASPKLARVLRELLDAYVEENGGDMPTSDGHPAHDARDLLEELDSD